jgi:hypothetical protein
VINYQQVSICLTILILLQTACAPQESSVPRPAATPSPSDCSAPAAWQIGFTRSGGFAGRMDTLTINNAGELHATSQRPQKEISQVLPQEKIEALTLALLNACPFDQPQTDGTCADCFAYALDIQMDGKAYHIEASDISVNPDLMALIAELSQLLGAALSN